MGLGIGSVTGGYGGYKYAQKNNLNPWSGKPLNNSNSDNYNLPVRRRGNPMNALKTNDPSVINNRLYTGHALDQMQGRGFVPSVVEDAINNPTIIAPGNLPNTIEYYNSQIKVITNTNGDVITVIPQ